MKNLEFDILIVGGGVIGSSVAHFLSSQSEARGQKICVVEPDPTYARSSTALSVGGIRQQFSTTENILLSRFTAEFIASTQKQLQVDKEPLEIDFVEGGYLFLASEAGLDILESNHSLQKSLGVDAVILSPAELRARFPWLEVNDLAAGSLGRSGEGWLDPFSLLQAFRKMARSNGVEYKPDRVIGMDVQGNRISRVSLDSGEVVSAGIVVNAAGPRAAEVATMAGIEDLPVHPRRRFVYLVHCREPIQGVPLTVDPSGVYFRPEGPDYLCGVSPPHDRDPDTLDLGMEYDLFEEIVWPALAHRVPAFNSLKLGPSWAGHYAVNTLDHNAIIGPHPRVTNFLFANGFSGHGLQHAPGVGRALSELIFFGEFKTIDLNAFAFERLEAGPLVQEKNVV